MYDYASILSLIRFSREMERFSEKTLNMLCKSVLKVIVANILGFPVVIWTISIHNKLPLPQTQLFNSLY